MGDDSWLDGLLGGVATFGEEVLSSVFTSETAMSAISGAAIGGIVAAVTGEDVLDGAILGGVGGTLYGAVGSYMNKQDAKDVAATSTDTYEEDTSTGLLDMTDIKEPLPATTISSKDMEAMSKKDFGLGSNDLKMPKTVSVSLLNNPTSTATPAPTRSDLSLYDRAKTGWGNLAAETKAEIIGKALSGGAAAYSADKTAKANEKIAAANNAAAMERDAAQYDRSKSKVGSTSGLRPNYAISPTSYSLARTNEPLLN